MGDNGDWVDEKVGDANHEDEIDGVADPVSDVFTRLRFCGRRKEKGESAEEKELLFVDTDLRLSNFSCFFFLSFLARCSPTSSRFGSVQNTSHMAEIAAASLAGSMVERFKVE